MIISDSATPSNQPACLNLTSVTSDPVRSSNPPTRLATSRTIGPNIDANEP